MPHTSLTTTPHQERKRAVIAELEAARAEFQRLLVSLSDDDWRRRSHNPGWTNGEILFHMVLGFFLLPMMCLLGRLPQGATRPSAAVLNLATVPFNWVNAFGPRIGGRLFRRRSLGRAYAWVVAHVLQSVETMPADEWQRGIYYPARWDALFRPYMTVEDLLRYPIVHLRFHTDQLAARSTETAQP